MIRNKKHNIFHQSIMIFVCSPQGLHPLGHNLLNHRLIRSYSSQNIPLAVFLSTFVDDSFLPLLEHKYKTEVDSATQGNQGLTAIKLPQKQSLWPRPLLQVSQCLVLGKFCGVVF